MTADLTQTLAKAEQEKQQALDQIKALTEQIEAIKKTLPQKGPEWEVNHQIVSQGGYDLYFNGGMELYEIEVLDQMLVMGGMVPAVRSKGAKQRKSTEVEQRRYIANVIKNIQPMLLILEQLRDVPEVASILEQIGTPPDTM